MFSVVAYEFDDVARYGGLELNEAGNAPIVRYRRIVFAHLRVIAGNVELATLKLNVRRDLCFDLVCDRRFEIRLAGGLDQLNHVAKLGTWRLHLTACYTKYLDGG